MANEKITLYSTESCYYTTMKLEGFNVAPKTGFDCISGVNFTVPTTDVKVTFNSLGNPVVAEYKIVNFQKMHYINGILLPN